MGCGIECGEEVATPNTWAVEEANLKGCQQDMEAEFGLFSVTVPNPQECYCVHKIVALNRFF